MTAKPVPDPIAPPEAAGQAAAPVAAPTLAVDRLLIAGIAVWVVIGYVGRAFAPTVLEEAPRLLLLVDQRFPSQLLAGDEVGTASFVLFATIGIAICDPLAFLLGRRQGPRAAAWADQRMPTTFRLTMWFERLFRRTAGAPVMFLGGLPACAVAGASGVSWGAFAVFDGIGVIVRLVAVIGLLAVAPDRVDAIGSAVGDQASLLTVLAILWVGIDLQIGRRRRRRRLPGVGAPVGGSSDR